VRPIAEIAYDLAWTPDKMGVRLYAPEPVADADHWGCTFEIDEPLALRQTIYGICSLQAPVLALQSLSASLYGSNTYRNGELGLGGIFGGDLSIPAMITFSIKLPIRFEDSSFAPSFAVAEQDQRRRPANPNLPLST